MKGSNTVFCPIIKAPQIAPRGLCAVRVCDYCGMLHNSDYDLCGTENRCANRLSHYNGKEYTASASSMPTDAVISDLPPIKALC